MPVSSSEATEGGARKHTDRQCGERLGPSSKILPTVAIGTWAIPRPRADPRVPDDEYYLPSALQRLLSW